MVREIGRRVAAAARRDEFSGVVLVAKGERTIFHQAYGLADRSWRIVNRLDTRFNLASMNKMFTAVAIAQLIEAGKLQLDAGLACYSIGRGSIGGNAIAPRRTTFHSSLPSRCCSSPGARRPVATRGMWCSVRSLKSSPP